MIDAFTFFSVEPANDTSKEILGTEIPDENWLDMESW